MNNHYQKLLRDRNTLNKSLCLHTSGVEDIFMAPGAERLTDIQPVKNEDS